MTSLLAQSLPHVDSRHIPLGFFRNTNFEEPHDQPMPPEEWCENLSPDAYHAVFFNGVWIDDFSSLPRFHPNFSYEHNEGLRLNLNDSCVLKRPIHFHYLFDSSVGSTKARASWELNLGAGARCELIETCEYKDSDHAVLGHISKSVKLAEKAELKYVQILDLPNKSHGLLDDSNFEIAARARCEIKGIFSGRGFLVAAPEFQLAGSEAHLKISTLALPHGGGALTLKSKINMRASMTRAEQVHRALVAADSKGIFGGLVHILEGLTKVEAFQQNKNLLLAETAQAYATPELKIDSDDVRCSHGATISRLRGEESFYLQSRGLSRNLSERLLSEGFARETLAFEAVTSYLKSALKENFEDAMKRVFP